MSRAFTLLFLLILSCFQAVADNWRVRTVCEPERFSGYSEPQSFTMGPCPGTELSESLSILGKNGYSATIRVYTGGVRYSIQWREANASQWQIIDDNAANDFVLTGLRNNTAYEVRAQTQCSATDRSTFSSPISFTTSCQAPYMTGGLTYGSVQVYSLYQANVLVQWRDEGTEAWNTSPLLNEFNGGIAVRYWFGGKANRAYEIRTQAVCADGSSSEFTPPARFTVYSESNASIQPVSINCIGWGSARISWGSNAVQQDVHTVQWRPKNAVCWNTSTLADSIQNPTYGSYTTPYGEHILRDLLPKTDYEYRLGTVLPDNAEPTFTEIQNFTTAAGDVYIYSNTVCPTLGADQVRLSWQTSECFGLSGVFECQYRPVGSADWQTAWLPSRMPYSLTGLTPNTTYEYRVRLTIPDQYVGEFSSIATFATGYGQIESLNILNQNGRDCTEQTMFWTGCGLRGAKFEVSYGEIGESGGAVLGQRVSDNTITLFGLIPQKTYQIQVQAVYADGTATPFRSQTFIAGCIPAPYDLPRDLCQYNITELSARLQWKGYGPFELRWRRAYTTAWNTVIVRSTYSSFPVVHKLMNLEPNVTYEWQVRSVRMEPVTFSSMQFFRTACNAPVYTRAKITSATSVSLIWTEADAGQQFTLHWRKQGEPAWKRVETIRRPDYVLDSLQRNTVYEWRVATQCTGGRPSAEGPVQTFKTVGYIEWLYTVQNGRWTDPTTWSCNRVPTTADGVQLLHQVNIPANQTGSAAAIRYGTGGNLTFDEKARLWLSF